MHFAHAAMWALRNCSPKQRSDGPVVLNYSTYCSLSPHIKAKRCFLLVFCASCMRPRSRRAACLPPVTAQAHNMALHKRNNAFVLREWRAPEQAFAAAQGSACVAGIILNILGTRRRSSSKSTLSQRLNEWLHRFSKVLFAVHAAALLESTRLAAPGGGGTWSPLSTGLGTP